MANHEFSVGDVIKVRNGVKLPLGYNITCGEWVGVVRSFEGSGRIAVKTLITRDGEWKKEDEYNPAYFVEERFFEIA